MQFLRDLATVLRQGGFRRLFAVRLTSQFSDGLFQATLASYVLFSPERQPTAGAMAATFAVLLLPFSVLAPFCGVLLDRWSRRQVLAWCNAARAVLMVVVGAAVAAGEDGMVFFGLVLATMSVNRLILAALSAGLPHVVPRHELVMANAVSPTCGTLAALAGTGVGAGIQLLLRPLLPHAGVADVTVVVAAAVGYLLASLLALRLGRQQLGPDHGVQGDVGPASSARAVLAGLIDGFRHLGHRRRAAYGLGVIAVQRFFYGTLTVAAVLLHRNLFHPGDPEAAMAGMATLVLASGAGFGVAALLTPVVTTRLRKETWMTVLLVAAAAAQLLVGGLFTEVGVTVAGFLIGVAAQGIKICVDTLVHHHVDDVYRGRVFALYDVLFNVVLVAAASFAAAVLPADGRSPALLAGAAATYVVAAVVYARLTRADDRGADRLVDARVG